MIGDKKNEQKQIISFIVNCALIFLGFIYLYYTFKLIPYSLHFIDIILFFISGIMCVVIVVTSFVEAVVALLRFSLASKNKGLISEKELEEILSEVKLHAQKLKGGV